MKILVKYPTRGRPKIFIERLEEWYESAVKPDDISWVVTFDRDDSSMNPITMWNAQRIVPSHLLRCVCGKSRTKIEACNADISKSEPWDVLLLISDDMVCRRHGWDDTIRAKMFEHYPDTDGCLWFHDGSKQRVICTMSCIGRKYYDRFGYVYHPSYKSFFCDNEFTYVAQKEGKIKFFENGIASHEHPSWGGNMHTDATYKANSKYWTEDEANFKKRQELGFPP